MKKTACFIAILIIFVSCVGCAKMAQNKAEYQARKAAFESGQITPDILRGLNMGRMQTRSIQGTGEDKQVIIHWVIRDYPLPNDTTYLIFVNGKLANKTIMHNTYRRR